MARSQGGVAAQRHLHARCEPAQAKAVRLGGLQQEGGFGLVVLSRQGLHPGVVAPGVERLDHTGGIAPVGLGGEGGDCPLAHGRADTLGERRFPSRETPESTKPAHETRDADGFEFSDARERLDLDRAWGWISRESYWAQGIPVDTFARSVGNSLCVSIFLPVVCLVVFFFVF